MIFDIETRRKELGLTLEDIGKYVGVSKSTVKKWETGMIDNMKRDKIALLAKILQVSPLCILGLDTEQNNSPLKSEHSLLLKLYNALNPIGKTKATEYIEDLVANPKYRNSTYFSDEDTPIKIVAKSKPSLPVILDDDDFTTT